MNNAGKYIGWVISLVLIVACFIDLASQLKAGEAIRWRVPIIFFGVGIGLPVILYVFFGGDRNVTDEGTDSDEERYEGGDD